MDPMGCSVESGIDRARQRARAHRARTRTLETPFPRVRAARLSYEVERPNNGTAVSVKAEHLSCARMQLAIKLRNVRMRRTCPLPFGFYSPSQQMSRETRADTQRLSHKRRTRFIEHRTPSQNT